VPGSYKVPGPPSCSNVLPRRWPTAAQIIAYDRLWSDLRDEDRVYTRPRLSGRSQSWCLPASPMERC